MFGQVTDTWNPVIGCRHSCVYCWARDLAFGRLKHLERYRLGFEPQLIKSDLKRTFKEGLIFTSSMGDLWGDWVPAKWINAVLAAIRKSPGATFLFCTKNPRRYHEFLELMPENVILGTTLESNHWVPHLSQAPPMHERWLAMWEIPGRRKMVSVEPILRFDLNIFPTMLRDIAPETVYVGYDNHGKHLPEPSLAKTKILIQALEPFTEVRQKTLRPAWWESGDEESISGFL